MTLKSFYRDDVLGYVTSSNSIPWLYDLDSCDVTAASLAAEEDTGDGDCKVRSDGADPEVDAALARRSSRLPQSGGELMSMADGFVKKFSESLCSSVINDAAGNPDEWTFSVPDIAAAVSKLTKVYVRNVAVLGVAMMFAQAPFYGVRSFASSLGGVSGRWALVAYHAAVIAALPIAGCTVASAHVRPKTSLVLSVIASLPFAVVAAAVLGVSCAMTWLLFPLSAAVAGAATAWVSQAHDTYITSLGASCAALADAEQRAAGDRPIAKHFIRVFSQYLLVMQQLSLFVGNFVTSAVIATTLDLTETPSTKLGIGNRVIVYFLARSIEFW